MCVTLGECLLWAACCRLKTIDSQKAVGKSAPVKIAVKAGKCRAFLGFLFIFFLGFSLKSFDFL